MENAHLRMGKLKFVRQTRDTITEVSLHLDRLVAEKPSEPRSAAQIHLVSVFVGAQCSFKECLRDRGQMPHRSLPAWNLERCAVHHRLLTQEPEQLGPAWQADLKSLLIRDGRRDGANFLVAAKDRHQMNLHCGTRLCGLFCNQAIHVQ